MSEAPKRTHYIRAMLVTGGSTYFYFTNEVAAQSVVAAFKEAKHKLVASSAIEFFHVADDGSVAHTLLDADPVCLFTMAEFGA